MFSADIAPLIRENESLAQHCWLRIGGNARYFAEVGEAAQLQQLCSEATKLKLPIRIIGGGSNVLVRKTGVDGVVIRLTDQLSGARAEGNKLVAGGGAELGDAMAVAAAAGLSGLEHIAGIPGSVGGAVVSNSGVTNDDIGSQVHAVRAVTREGNVVELGRSDLQFGFRRSNLADLIVFEVEFALEPANAADITRRLQAAWIVKKAAQPASGTRAAQAFIEPSGVSIAHLLDAAGMRAASEGEVTMSPTLPGYLVVNENADAEQVLALIARVVRAVEAQSGVQLQPQLKIW